MQLNFEIAPEITKDLLLSKYSEETFMEYYLGIPVKKGLFRNPLRNDHKPTASFYRNRNGELIFKDFGWNFYGNFINVVMSKYALSYHEALKKIAIDFGFIKGDTTDFVQPKVSLNAFKDQGPSKIQIQIQDFTKEELDWWNNFGVSKSILEKYYVYSCKTVFLNDKLFAQSSSRCPIYGYYFDKNDKNLELWRIYFPKRKTFRFISNTSSKVIQGFEQLPKNGKVLVITKSLKDVMVLSSFGIPAIAPNSENLFVDNETFESLKTRFKHIIAFYDNDLPGVMNMIRIRREHPEIVYTWIPLNYNAKDISDFYRDYGRSKTLELITQFLIWLSKTSKPSFRR